MALTKRNYALDFLKFIFAIIVMLFHGNTLTSISSEMIFVNGRIGVEFFFLVSGCLLCMSALSADTQTSTSLGEETYRFIRKKAKSLLPNFFVAYFIAFAVFHYNSGIHEPLLIIKHIVQSLPELLMIKNSGIKSISYNGVTWYISAMLLSMVLIYPLMRRYKDTFFYIIAPTVFLFIMGNFFQNYGSLSNLENWNGFILNGTARAFADLLGGCMCWKAATKLRQYDFTSLGKLTLTIFEWAAYLISIVLIYRHPPSGYDYFVLLLFMIGVTITFSRVGYDDIIFNHRIFGWFGTYSLSLYLGHSCWRKYTNNIFPKEWNFHERLFAYIVISVFAGLFIMYTSIGLKKMWKQSSYRIKALFIKDHRT